MAPTCCALTCKNRQKKGSGITFHSFPRNPVRRQKWLEAIHRSNWTPPSHAVICSVHFEDTCFDRTGQTVRLRENSVPTLLVSQTSYIMGRGYCKSLPQDKISDQDLIPGEENGSVAEERRNCEEVDMQDHNYPKRNQPSHLGEKFGTLETCFICGKMVANGTPLHFLTEITKVQFLHKLDNILSELSLVMDDKGMLCSCCTRLINYIDHTEVQLSKLNKSILNCVYARHVEECHNVDLQLPDFVDKSIQVASLIEDKDLTEDGEDLHSNRENESDNHSEKLHKCKICSFKTNYKSIMVYHLRQHLVTTRRCDFCCKTLPPRTRDHRRITNGDSESLSEIEGTMKSLNDLGEEVIAVQSEGTVKSLNDLGEEDIAVQSLTNCTEHEDCKCKTKTLNLDCRSPKDMDMKIKYIPFEPESVEDMVEELHETGQVSAFMINPNYDYKSSNIHCKMKDMPEKRTDVSATIEGLADESSHKLVKRELVNSQCKMKDTFDRLDGTSVTIDECTHKIVKRELMNVDEISDHIVKEPTVFNCNQDLIDFLEVKRESPGS